MHLALYLLLRFLEHLLVWMTWQKNIIQMGALFFNCDIVLFLCKLWGFHCCAANAVGEEFLQNVEAECVIREWVKRWFGRFSHSHHPPQCLCTAHKQIQHQCMWWWLLLAEVHSVWLLGDLIWAYLKWYNYKGHTPTNFHRFRNWPERHVYQMWSSGYQMWRTLLLHIPVVTVYWIYDMCSRALLTMLLEYPISPAPRGRREAF